MSNIDREIAQKKQELYEAINEFNLGRDEINLSGEKIIKLSQELDLFIVEKQKIEMRKQQVITFKNGGLKSNWLAFYLSIVTENSIDKSLRAMRAKMPKKHINKTKIYYAN